MVFSAAWSTVTACRVPVALTSGSLLIQAILQDVIAVVIALAGFFPAKMSVEAIGTYFGVTVASQKKAFKTTVMHVFDHLRQQHAPQPLVFMTRQQRQHHDFSTLTVGEAVPGHLPVNAGYIAGATAIFDARAPALFCNAQGGKLLFRKAFSRVRARMRRHSRASSGIAGCRVALLIKNSIGLFASVSFASSFRASSRCKGRGEKWLGVGATLTAHSQHSRNAAGSRHNESRLCYSVKSGC